MGALDFHLALAAASRNPLLAETLPRLLRPLFTFVQPRMVVLLRMVDSQENIGNWRPATPRHRE